MSKNEISFLEALLEVPAAREAKFERGFKARSENISLGYRRTLGFNDNDPLDPATLAQLLHVKILDLSTLGLPDDSLKHLTSDEGNEWSAVTVGCGAVDVIVVNPTHSPARQSSNIMHELSHVVLGHKSRSSVATEDGITLRVFDPSQEAEADWLAGALLLPRPALVRIGYSGRDNHALLLEYGVSKKLLDYRLRITGVSRQVARSFKSG
jgi:hypothetical protein